ncbi:MAG: NCS2 family permease [Lachnospiraceae bacterium]|nr:NCS2 family permease [Lachnospiraceae bacterium]
MEKLFKLKQNNTNVRTEVIAGLTTFMTMAYIIMLNPNLLIDWGQGSPALWNAIFLATCISSAIAMFVMAFLANKPFGLAPGMGLNAFFASVVTSIAGMGIAGVDSYDKAFQVALCIILIEGVVFLILSLFSIREKIVEALPLGIRLGISPAIGLMLLNIGFGSNNTIFGNEGKQFYMLRDFFGSLTAKSASDAIGSGYSEMVLSVATTFIGLFIIVILAHHKVKASVLIGMLGASCIFWAGQAIFLDTNPFESLKNASFIPAFGDLADKTLFKFDFSSFFDISIFTVITLIITFCIIDMFDTIGTLVGTASRANMLDENGKMPQMREALTADAVGTVVGAVTGTSTVTTFIESASGVEAGGRTGLTALVTGLCFLACIFLAPVAAVIPPAATSAALIYVGILMFSGLKKINFDDMSQVLPVAIMVIAMPITSSIGHAIGLGLICYSVFQTFTGNAKKVSILTYVLSLIFLIKFMIPV